MKENNIAKKLNDSVALAVGSSALAGFEKAFQISTAINQLQELLTDEYMKPIMALQGSRLGFKTDKDKDGGYPTSIVKVCLIDAVLTGLQPTNNEFNIIGGNMYPTREGFGALLKNIKKLKYTISYHDVKVAPDKKTAEITAKIKWEYNKEENEESITFNIKSNPYATVDALIGKCERKARKWLYNTINGTDLQDADADDIIDIPAEVVNPETPKVSKEERILAQVKQRVEAIDSIDKLKEFYGTIQNPSDEINDIVSQRKKELQKASK